MKRILLSLCILSVKTVSAQIIPPPGDTGTYYIRAKETKINNTLIPLVVIDGKVWGTPLNAGQLDSLITAQQPKQVNVLKEKQAIEKYGKPAANGALEIVTEKGMSNLVKPGEAQNNYEVVYEKPEQDASFPGGDVAWRRYLERNANAQIPTDKGAPTGIYKAVVQFIVDKEGNLSDFKALTSHGYGVEAELFRLLTKGPLWLPAKQNGNPVKSLRKQMLTFIVETDGFEVTVEGGKPYELKAGISNIITVTVDKTADEDLEMSLSAGTINRVSEGKYEIKVDKPGTVLLTVRNKKKNKEVGRVSFTVL
ncbi:MAG: hypothetical protein NTW29_13195 [Bacteroidetes bacterium]|nr:hypothetical protein [Bacteroidota bacterium]